MLQEKILEHYETDSTDICDQIDYWKCVRLENAIYYAAREHGLKTINHHVVPTFQISKSKAHEAIELQMALESLAKSEFKNELWTLQDTCQELYQTPPQQCFKKQGQTVEVRYDGDKDNTMHYTSWDYIYYVTEGDKWCKTKGYVNYCGLYYIKEGQQTYYVQFKCDAQQYGQSGKWEVWYNGKKIECVNTCDKIIQCSESMYSTCDETVSATAIARELQHPTTPYTEATTVCTQKSGGSAPTRKPFRHCGFTETSEVDGLSVDHLNNPLLSAPAGNNGFRKHTSGDTTPIVHLKGDKNRLKCLRYRLQKFHNLYTQISCTWHWIGGKETTRTGILTLAYANENQRQKFLDVVKIPNTVNVSLGYMTL